jgi:hypothetical protein
MLTKSQGSVAVEGCIAVAVFALVTPFLVDAVKRAQYQAGLHRAAFVFTRLRSLGVTVPEAKREVLDYLRDAFGERGYEISESITGSGRWGAVHLRFEMSGPFRLRGGARHHLEVTERCLFPY